MVTALRWCSKTNVSNEKKICFAYNQLFYTIIHNIICIKKHTHTHTQWFYVLLWISFYNVLTHNLIEQYVNHRYCNCTVIFRVPKTSIRNAFVNRTFSYSFVAPIKYKNEHMFRCFWLCIAFIKIASCQPKWFIWIYWKQEKKRYKKYAH